MKYLKNDIKIVTWAGGSWEDISAMLEAHYKGDIDITDYWSNGDTRRINLKNGESIDLVLIGNNHDDLVTEINGKSKAVFTIQTKNCLETKMRMFDSYDYPKSSSWGNSNIRKYLNTEFYQNLPGELQVLIKKVCKATYRNAYATYSSCRASTTTEDAVFLLSEMEVYGTQIGTESNWGRGADGAQYKYYKTASNRIKYIDGTAQTWWLRSSRVGSGYNSFFYSVTTGNVIGICRANDNHGLAPAFCI